MEKIKKLITDYKKWAAKHPIKSTFLTGFVLGFILGAVLC
jgi:hypothetical protein